MVEECANIKPKRNHFWILLENHRSDEFQEGILCTLCSCQVRECKAQVAKATSVTEHSQDIHRAKPWGWDPTGTPSQTPQWLCYRAKGAPSSPGIRQQQHPWGRTIRRWELKVSLPPCWSSTGRSGKAPLELPKWLLQHCGLQRAGQPSPADWLPPGCSYEQIVSPN